MKACLQKRRKKTETIRVRVDVLTHAQLHEVAEREFLAPSDIVRRALALYFARSPRRF